MSENIWHYGALRDELTCTLTADAPADRLTQDTDLERTGRYIPVVWGHPLWDHQCDAEFLIECLQFAKDRALWGKDKDKQLLACLLDKCARIASRYVLPTTERPE